MPFVLVPQTKAKIYVGGIRVEARIKNRLGYSPKEILRYLS